MSVHFRAPDRGEGSYATGPSAFRITEVHGSDHSVRLHPHQFAPHAEFSHTVLLPHVDVEKLGLAYDAATLAVRLLGRGWAAVAGPVVMRAPEADEHPARATISQVDHAAPYAQALLSLPLAKRIVVARTLFAVLTRPGTQRNVAQMLHISVSTLRNHLESVSRHLPPSVQLQDYPALSYILPTLMQLWHEECGNHRRRPIRVS